MASALTKLNDTIKAINNKSASFQSVDKDEIQKLIIEAIRSCDNFLTLVNLVNPEEENALRQKYQEGLIKKKSEGYFDIYSLLQKHLSSKSKALENTKLFGSLEKTASVFKETMEFLDKNLNTFINESELTFKNCKISGLLMLLLLKASTIFSLYCECFYAQYFDIALTNVSFGNPKYKNLFIIDKTEYVSFFINKSTETSSFSAFVTEFINLQKKGNDLLLVNSQGLTFTNFMVPGTLSLTTQHMFGLMPNLNIFQHIGNMLENRRYANYQKNLKKLEWLKQRVALLKLDLADMDPDDPRYAQLVKTIQIYDDEITKLDAKIMQYLEGD